MRNVNFKEKIGSIVLLLVLQTSCFSAFAAEVQSEDGDKSEFSIGADIYNRYVWRGTDFGNSPVVQPGVSFTSSFLTIGAWGSYSLSSNTGGTEADLYLSLAFTDNFSMTFTDYFFPSESGVLTDYFDYKNNHTEELGISYSLGDFSIAANSYLKEDPDLYFEAQYAFKKASVFIGGGNQSYTQSGDFNICNIGVSLSKDIAITEKFSIPMSGSLVLNPNTEQLFILVGISL